MGLFVAVGIVLGRACSRSGWGGLRRAMSTPSEALLWNELFAHNAGIGNPRKLTRPARLRAVMYCLDPALLALHVHTKQTVVDDLLDAMATFRAP